MNQRFFAERKNRAGKSGSETFPTGLQFRLALFQPERGLSDPSAFVVIQRVLRAHRAFELTAKRDQGSVCERIFFPRLFRAVGARARLKLARPRRENLFEQGIDFLGDKLIGTQGAQAEPLSTRRFRSIR